MLPFGENEEFGNTDTNDYFRKEKKKLSIQEN